MRTIIVLFMSILISTLALSSSFAAAEAAGNRPKLPQIQDIRETVQLAKSRQLPILIMFGTEECPYCQLLREDFLVPMIISGDYVNKVIFREVHVSYNNSLTDFSGKKITAREFASRYNVKLFPTTVLLDQYGKPLVKSIIGITTPSLFGGTLDDTIDKALTTLRSL